LVVGGWFHGKRAGRGAIRERKRPARFERRQVAERGVRPDSVVVVAPDLCRKHGISEGTFYNWKAKFGDMTVSESKRLKTLEDDNAKQERLLAEQMLDLAAMKELVSKNW